MARALVVALVVVLAGLAASGARPPSAWACSCAGEPAAEWLDESDAAFVGELVAWRVERPRAPARSSGDPAFATFRVERAVKGTLPRVLVVRTVSSTVSCGLAARRGDRVGLLLERRGGEWTSGLCLEYQPSELESLPAAGRIEPDVPAGAPRGGGLGTTTVILVIGAAAALALGLAWVLRRRGVRGGGG